ncbi:hypothetical protein FLM9_136 [Candidatus Synechococcus spongiarum]|uniref:Uncharacterized protein n=1 Tax=Candidatus Synechococcus spongiarum TaxID=431041 RepID=A0A171DEI4_9SYNE|nr:hypothetical protein FLM9_136 [Candidatus Synechococcus spongiarum]
MWDIVWWEPWVVSSAIWMGSRASPGRTCALFQVAKTLASLWKPGPLLDHKLCFSFDDFEIAFLNLICKFLEALFDYFK